MTCRYWFEQMHCDDCNDRLIHQTLRGPNEASSGFTQFIHDEVAFEMWLADIDAMFYANRNHLCRIIEHKHPGDQLKPSQSKMLPLLAIGLELLKQPGLVHPASAVYMLESDAPYRSALIRQILPQRILAFGPVITLEDDQLKSFLVCNVQDWEMI
jgi:hypothetical protein